jgi:hypothetical protein
LVVWAFGFFDICVISSSLKIFLESGQGAESSNGPVNAGEQQQYNVGKKEQRDTDSQVIFGFQVPAGIYNGVGRRADDQAVCKG